MKPISVKDEMPPLDVEVLVFCYEVPLKEGSARNCCDYGFNWNEWNFGRYCKGFPKPNGWKDSDYNDRCAIPHWNHWMYEDVVTHWMHKPPKPEGLE